MARWPSYGIQSDDTLVLDQVLGGPGLDEPSAVAVDPANDNVYVASQAGISFGAGGLASFTPAPTATPHSLALTYRQIQTLNVNLGNSDNSLGETHYATTGPATSTPALLNITVGNGADTFSLLNLGGTTTVTTGNGPDHVTVHPGATDPLRELTIKGGGGNNFVELDGTVHGAQITIDLGSGNSTAQVKGTALDDQGAGATINGGSGVDTLLFDAQGNPIETYKSSGAPTNPSGLPATPDGQIQITGHNNPRLVYTEIDDIPNFVGAIVSAGGPYTPITEGQPVTLAGTATAATSSTIESEAWDVNGAGTFNAAVGLDPTLSWAKLVALGVNGPGHYPITLRVVSSSNTVFAYSTLTIAPTAPVLSVSAASTATAGVPYSISFSGQEVPGANYGITGWTITWGDGTTSTLPSDATSATHTYTTAANTTISLTAMDPYFPATTVSVPIKVSVGPQSVNAGGPSYAIGTGDSLVLTGTAAGAPSGFLWFYNGDPLTVTGQTTSAGTGSTTDQVTVPWNALQALGVDEESTGAITVTADYAGGISATSAPATLTVNPTPPTAMFAGTATLGGTGTVSFTNPFDWSAAQKAAGVTYSFDFYDNGTFEIAGSTIPSAALPASLAAQPGSFVVHGRITAQDRQFTDYYTTINVADVAPTVSAGPDQTISPGSPFTLSGVTFSDQGYATPAASWNFTSTIDWGDCTSSLGALTVTQGSSGVLTTGVISGSHLYQPDQKDTVTVTVFDSDGEQGSGSFHVTVGAPTVTVTAGPDQTVGAGSVFIASQTVFTDNAAPDTDTVTINWGDGSAVETVPAAELAAAAAPGAIGTIEAGHIYGYPGSYSVTVTAADSFAASDSGSFQVNVLDVAPTVTAGPNLHQSPGIPVSLSSTFTDPAFPVGGLAETYTATINWGDGTTGPGSVRTTPGGPGVPTSGTITGTHTYATHGDYAATVTVFDSLGPQGSATLSVLDTPPAVTAGSDQTVNQGSPVVVAATFNDPGFEAGATAASYPATIEWGDGTSSSGTVTVTPGGPGKSTTGTVSGSHIYADQGNYTVTVVVADDGGGAGQGSFTATVSDVGPTLSAIPNGVYVSGQPLIIQDSFTEPGIADQDTVTVDWGNGTTSTLDDASTYTNAQGVVLPNIDEPTASSPGNITFGLLYNDNNPHTITVTITDKDGLSDSVTATFVPETTTTTTVTSSTPGDTSVYGQSVTFTATVTVATGGPPTGSVEFYDGSTDLGPGSALSGSGSTATSTFTISTLTATNHVITATYVPADTTDYTTASATVTINVAPATLTVTTILPTSDIGHGDTVPTPTASFSGFVNGDTAAVVSGSVSFTGLPTTSSPAGIYTVTPITSGLSATNYDFTNVVSATLNVHPVVTNILVKWGSETMSIVNLNRDLPFFNVTGLEVTYSDPVNIAGTGLALTSTAGGATYAPVKVGSGQGTTAETWNLPTAIGIDRLMLALDQANTVAANAPSLKLFGLTSQAFSILPGDFDGDGVVSSADVIDINNATTGPYDIWADLNGDGTVDITDVKLARSKIGTSLPPP